MLDLPALRRDGILGLDAGTFEELLAECERLRDFPARWASMGDAECAAALRAAPRVAGEWHERGRWCVRHGERDRVVALCSEAGARSSRRWRWTMCDDAGGPNGYADSESEARSACDAALRAAGWRVIG